MSPSRKLRQPPHPPSGPRVPSPLWRRQPLHARSLPPSLPTAETPQSSPVAPSVHPPEPLHIYLPAAPPPQDESSQTTLSLPPARTPNLKTPLQRQSPRTPASGSLLSLSPAVSRLPRPA